MVFLLAGCQQEQSLQDPKQLIGAPRSTSAMPAKIGLCAGCHGQDGRSVLPTYPNLAGQKPLYLAKALKAYQSGERNSAEMKVVVGHLTDAEIEELSLYYSQLP